MPDGAGLGRGGAGGHARHVPCHGKRSAADIRTVWQIAQRDYKFGRGKHKSLTKATYDAVGDHFRALWGKEAGWAHSVLFTADLRAFSEQLRGKIEVDEVVVKSEGDQEAVSTVVKVEQTVDRGVKREAEDADDEDDLKKMVQPSTDARGQRAKRRRG